MKYDLLIVGGGPIGIACALQARKRGLTHLILEKGVIVNSLYNYPRTMQFFSSSERLEIDEIPFISKEAKPRRDEALEYYRRIVSSYRLNIRLFEEVLDVCGHCGDFQVRTARSHYEASHVVLATGFYDKPNMLGIPGEQLPKVSHYYTEPHYYSTTRLAVVGASNSAIDAALECWRKGAEVSLIIRGEEVGQRVKYWVRPDVINRIEEGSIKAYYRTTVQEIRPDRLILKGPEGVFELENDFVLALTGYRPNFEFLEKVGLGLSGNELRKPIYDEETMETTVSGIYLAGVICGGMETHKWFIENSLIHAELITEDIKCKLHVN